MRKKGQDQGNRAGDISKIHVRRTPDPEARDRRVGKEKSHGIGIREEKHHQWQTEKERKGREAERDEV